MFETLLQLDRHLFHFINHDLGNAFFDSIMPHIRNPYTWIPLYLCIIGFCCYTYKKTGVIIIILLALSAGFADFTSASIIKPLVKRVRPCNDPIVSKTDIMRVDCGPAYSFPSTHATDHFAMAVFLILVFYKKWPGILPWTILWASLISFAQVYVGVHYPIDVIGGAIYGALVGSLFFVIFKKLQPQF